jgi:diguanylate cyclase (GGDEF)-like protein
MFQSSEYKSYLSSREDAIGAADYNQTQQSDKLYRALGTSTAGETARAENCIGTLKTQTEVLSTVLQTIQDAVIVLNATNQIIYLNPAANQLTGRITETDEYGNLSVYDVLKLSERADTPSLLTHNFFELSDQDYPIAPRILWLTTKDLELKKIEFSQTHTYTENHQLDSKILILRECIDQTNLVSELSWKTNHDALTGLMNRAFFENYLAQMITETQETSANHLLCYLNLDRFKVINETCGHLAGDKFLQDISSILKKRIRKTDIIARLGGDEFGIILQNCSLDESHCIIEALLEEINKSRFSWGENLFSMTVSTGLVVICSTSENHTKLISVAKYACDTAKQKGRNRYHIYQENDTDLVAQRGEIQWIPRINKALEENKFVLYKQPIVSLKNPLNYTSSEAVRTCEILIRLLDATGKMIFPGDFIPAAEKYSLMPMIDRWVIHSLFEHLSSKNNFGLCSISCQDSFDLYMINLSGASLNDEEFLDFVEEQLALYQIDPKLLCFEITETIAISNISRTIHLIQRLKDLGCYFALDDFGSGMSSFGYLKSLPVDFVKIDGMFIKDVVQQGVAREIVEAINRIAHVMNIKTIAEYVEDEEIYTQLQHLNVDFAQGYGIARPSALQP